MSEVDVIAVGMILHAYFLTRISLPTASAASMCQLVPSHPPALYQPTSGRIQEESFHAWTAITTMALGSDVRVTVGHCLSDPWHGGEERQRVNWTLCIGRLRTKENYDHPASNLLTPGTPLEAVGSTVRKTEPSNWPSVYEINVKSYDVLAGGGKDKDCLMRLGWHLGTNGSESEGEFFRVTVDNPTLCARWTEKSALAKTIHKDHRKGEKWTIDELEELVPKFLLLNYVNPAPPAPPEAEKK